MITGIVLRSHAGGYLVHSDELSATLKCAARGRLKKERVSIVTGDQVELDEIDSGQGTAVIAAQRQRRNLLGRPLIANVDQVVIVQAVHQPEWNPLLCDRYLVHFQLALASRRPLICLNKCDLAQGEDLAALQNIYEPLGYRVIVVSAVSGQGMTELASQLSGKISVLAGQSGVGKSSLINRLVPSLNLKVGIMEHDFGVGRHTTTSSELYRIPAACPNALSSWVADTPGFSLSELKHPAPADLPWQFPELEGLAIKCKYSDCLHLVEAGCNVQSNLNQISPSRFNSYASMVREAQIEMKSQNESSQKIESAVKLVGGRVGKGTLVPRLNSRYRATSRRLERQQTVDTLKDKDEIEDAGELS